MPAAMTSSLETPPSYAIATGADATTKTPLPLRYTQVSSSQGTTYLVRNDGTVDRSTGSGKVSQQMLPPAGAKYVAVSTDQWQCYLLTDTGVIVRTTVTGRGKTSIGDIINPPPGLAYTAVSAGPVASYFIRSDGVAVRTGSGGKITSEMFPLAPAATTATATANATVAKYTAASAGLSYSYLLRDDGRVDRVRGGVVVATLDPYGELEGVTFIQISDQLTVSSQHETHSSYAIYLVRSDGLIERLSSLTKNSSWFTRHRILTPSGCQMPVEMFDYKYRQQHLQSSASSIYTSASGGDYCSYLIQSDGACCRTVTGGKIHTKMIPEPGTKYIQAAAGQYASYLLRDDGAVVRTVTKATINCVMIPQPLNTKLVRTVGNVQAAAATTEAKHQKQLEFMWGREPRCC